MCHFIRQFNKKLRLSKQNQQMTITQGMSVYISVNYVKMDNMPSELAARFPVSF